MARVWWLLLSCRSEPLPPVADRAALREALRFPGELTDPETVFGDPWQGAGYTVRPVSLDARRGFRVGAAWFEPEELGGDGVIVACGHFDQGKSGPEAQEIAHRLAARGIAVLIVDNPGSEEWGTRDRALHFQRGAHNRAWLMSGGSSALALQLAALQAGLELMEAQGIQRVVATGASGGAVLSFWLALLDERVSGVVLASAPAVPREPAGGCDCKTLPDFPGPDPSVLRALPVPSLWLKESDVPPLEGLPENATWLHTPGPHSYTVDMQRQAVAWIDEHFGRRSGPWLEELPSLTLRTAPHAEGRVHQRLWQLPLAPSSTWLPRAEAGLTGEITCQGEGPTVLTLGASPEDHSALLDGGFQACALELPEQPWGSQERVAGAVQQAVDTSGAVAAWGSGGWSLAVAAAGRPYLLRSPPLRPEDLALESDPVWVHVPGMWWGLAPTLWSGALATSDKPEPLVEALSSEN